MAKKNNKQSNRYYTNKFPNGGIIPDKYLLSSLKPLFNIGNAPTKLTSPVPSLGGGGGSNFMSSLGSGITDFFSSGLGINMISNAAFGLLNPNGNSTGVGNVMQDIGGLASNIPGAGGIIGAAVGAVGGLVNTAFGSNINEENVALFRELNKQLANYTSNASTNEELLADFSGLTHLADVNRKDVGSDGWFSNKAKNLTKDINAERLRANLAAITSLGNTALTVDTTNDLLKGYNYSAYGGPINMKYTGTMSPFDNQFKDGGIYIKPSKRGTFTAAAKKHDKSVLAFASQVLANKENYSPAMIKKANFARNASKWHDNGGPLEEENLSSNYNIKPVFIGGTKSEARKKYFNLDKELTQIVTNLANSYGISPALVIDRLAHEGIIDALIIDHNMYVQDGGKGRPSNAFSNNTFNSPYNLFGLDTIFDTYTKGATKTKRPINFKRMTVSNESREKVNSGITNNIYDTLELFTAELASRREQVKKQYPNLTDTELDSATAARYNSTNKYFKRLMDSGEYKIKYPIDVRGINIPIPTKSDSKYIQNQVQRVNKSDIINNFNRPYYNDELIDNDIFTVGNKSYNPYIFIENNKFNSDSPLVDRFVDNYVNRMFTVPNKVKVINDYDENIYENALGEGHEDYAFGGELTHGGVFSNNVLQVNEGGTHLENPYDGILLGVDEQGIPNLVEEGELIWNDYVFSNRLKVPKAVRLKYKLRGNKELSFADAAKNILKESEERPNDVISLNGLDAGLSRLAMEQELIRMKKLLRLNRFDIGGHMKMEDLSIFNEKSPVITTPPPIYEPIPDEDEIILNTGKSKGFKESPLRYAPIVGHAVGVISDIFSKPYYLAADEVRGIELNPSLVGFTPIGNKLRFTPYDINFQINKANANAGASRRNIMNTSGGNRAAAMAGLMGVDTNYYNALGDAYRLALLYNDARRDAVETFNRATAQYNAEMGLKAAMANAEARNAMARARYERDKAAALLGQLARDTYNTRRSNNLNILLEDLGNLGRERNNRNWLDILADKDVLKMNTKGQHVSSNTGKNGGKLNRKKKGGFTYA